MNINISFNFFSVTYLESLVLTHTFVAYYGATLKTKPCVGGEFKQKYILVRIRPSNIFGISDLKPFNFVDAWVFLDFFKHILF